MVKNIYHVSIKYRLDLTLFGKSPDLLGSQYFEHYLFVSSNRKSWLLYGWSGLWEINRNLRFWFCVQFGNLVMGRVFSDSI